MRVGLPALLPLLLLPSLAWAGPGAGEPGFKEVRDRGVHYLRMGRHEAAVAELDKALAMPGGEDDFATHHALARATYALLRLERTFPLARRAVELGGVDEGGQPTPAARKARALLKELESFFGGVTLQKAPEARTDAGYLYIEDSGGLINAKKKDVFRALRERYRTEPSRLPVTIWLPFGRYTANRVPFETRAGDTPTILVIPDAESAAGGARWWWIAAGASAVAGAAVAAVALLWGDDAGGAGPARRQTTSLQVSLGPSP